MPNTPVYTYLVYSPTRQYKNLLKFKRVYEYLFVTVKKKQKTHTTFYVLTFHNTFDHYQIKVHNKDKSNSRPSVSYLISQKQSSCSHLLQTHSTHSDPVHSCRSSSNVQYIAHTAFVSVYSWSLFIAFSFLRHGTYGGEGMDDGPEELKWSCRRWFSRPG